MMLKHLKLYELIMATEDCIKCIKNGIFFSFSEQGSLLLTSTCFHLGHFLQVLVSTWDYVKYLHIGA
jgi:hypothetical protein